MKICKRLFCSLLLGVSFWVCAQSETFPLWQNQSWQGKQNLLLLNSRNDFSSKNLKTKVYFPETASFTSTQLQTISHITRMFDFKIHPEFLSLLHLSKPQSTSIEVALVWVDLGDLSGKDVWALVNHDINKQTSKQWIILNSHFLNSQKYSWPTILIHELQHLYNFSFRQKQEFHWLDEGLSELCEFHFTQKLPLQTLRKMLMANQVGPLFTWDNTNNLERREIQYGEKFLFLWYLYNHFGGANFLSEMISQVDSGNPLSEIERVLSLLKQKNIHQVDDVYLTRESLFLNYSMALFFNSQQIGLYQLFSFSGEQYIPEVSGLHIQTQFLSLDMIESTKISQRYELTESSTLYFRLPRGNYKLEVNTTNDLQVVKASKILGLFVPNQYSWKIQTDTKKIVIDEKEEAYLILVNPSMKRQSLILSLQLKN